jgi:hypothetical protein
MTQYITTTKATIQTPCGNTREFNDQKKGVAWFNLHRKRCKDCDCAEKIESRREQDVISSRQLQYENEKQARKDHNAANQLLMDMINA